MQEKKIDKPKKAGRPRSFDRNEALTLALDLFWKKGYELTGIAELCTYLNISPPSLYSTFASKSALFLEALRLYKQVYWDTPYTRLQEEADVHQAFKNLFNDALIILSQPKGKSGCMLVLTSISVSSECLEIIDELKLIRKKYIDFIHDRLLRAIDEKQIPADTDVKSLAYTIYALLEGMAVTARSDGQISPELRSIANTAMLLLP